MNKPLESVYQLEYLDGKSRQTLLLLGVSAVAAFKRAEELSKDQPWTFLSLKYVAELEQPLRL